MPQLQPHAIFTQLDTIAAKAAIDNSLLATDEELLSATQALETSSKLYTDQEIDKIIPNKQKLLEIVLTSDTNSISIDPTSLLFQELIKEDCHITMEILIDHASSSAFAVASGYLYLVPNRVNNMVTLSGGDLSVRNFIGTTTTKYGGLIIGFVNGNYTTVYNNIKGNTFCSSIIRKINNNYISNCRFSNYIPSTTNPINYKVTGVLAFPSTPNITSLNIYYMGNTGIINTTNLLPIGTRINFYKD